MSTEWLNLLKFNILEQVVRMHLTSVHSQSLEGNHRVLDNRQTESSRIKIYIKAETKSWTVYSEGLASMYTGTQLCTTCLFVVV